MQLKKMLVISLVSCTLHLKTMKPPPDQIMMEKPIQKQSIAGYESALHCHHAPDSHPAKQQIVPHQDCEKEQEYTPSIAQQPAHIVKLCDLEAVRRLNKEGDPLIDAYEQRNTLTKTYPTSACLEFFAHVKKYDEPSKPVTTKSFSGSAESATHRGVVSVAYFFSSKQYFCTLSLRHPNGQFMPPRYLDDSTFGALYTLFQEQEMERKLAQLKKEQNQRHSYLEEKLRALAATQRKKDLISCQTSIHTG